MRLFFFSFFFSSGMARPPIPMLLFSQQWREEVQMMTRTTIVEGRDERKERKNQREMIRFGKAGGWCFVKKNAENQIDGVNKNSYY